MFGPGYSEFRWKAVGVLSLTIAIVFLAQCVEQVWLRTNILNSYGALTTSGLHAGHLWTILSYPFLHGGFWHAALNILALLLIGLPLEEEIGSRAMTLVLFLLTLAGGLAFSLVHIISPDGVLIGASCIAIGLLTLYCLSYPDRSITLLLFFVLPVTLRPKWILIFTLAVNLFGLVFGEIAPGGSASVGYSAGLGGMLGAWIIQRFCLRTYTAASLIPPALSQPSGVQKKVIFKGIGQAKPKPPVDTKAVLQKEVDRILDKINTKGFGSLTAKEKETLDKAKDILGK